MAGSVLTGFTYIPENSEATPGLWNNVFSVMSQNIAEANNVGGIVSNVSTVGVVTINANSNVTDYLSFTDSSNARSNYLFGSHAGGTADGLNLYDASGATMIVSFSKQSVRFYQKIVGPVFDVGGGIFNVKAYGAVGDGVTDDTGAIQLAINTAGAAGGGVVYIPSSTSNYVVVRQANSAALVVPYNNIYIQVDPAATVALQNTATAAYLLFLGDISNITQYTNIWVYGGKWSASSSTDATCIRSGWVKNAGVIGAECFGIGGSVGGSAGINFAGISSATRSSDVIISNNYIHDLTGTVTQDAILTANIDKVAIYGNRIQNTGRAIFLFGAHSDAAVYGNVCRTMADNGIRVSTSNGGSFTDNQAVAVVGNVVEGTAIDGIRVDALKSTIASNIVRLSAQRGIKSDLCKNTIISGNVVSDCSMEGIYFAQAATVEYTGFFSQNLIENNSVNSNGAVGIRIQGGGFAGNQLPLGNAIIGNYCYNNAGGIECDDTDNTLIANNLLEQNANAYGSGNKFAISLIHSIASQASHGYLIQGNRAWDLRTSGNRQVAGLAVQVTVSGATLNRVTIRNNDFSDCITNGITIPTPTGSLTNVIATGNILLNNATPFRDDSALAGGSPTLPEVVISSELSLGFYRSGASHLGLSYGAMSFPDGTALLPSYTFSSESSLGFYRSGTSHLGLSYGGVSLPDGTTLLPSYTFSSESSAGFFRSANSVVALSYGTLSLPQLAIQTSGGIALAGASSNTWRFTANSGTNVLSIGYNGGASANWQTDGSISLNAINPTLVRVPVGTALAPPFTFASEVSLGLYRSAASILALSYGTLDLTASGAVTSLASITVKSGANNSCGTAVLGSNGSVNVANTYVKTGDLIFLTDQTPGGTLGDLELGGIRNSSGFTIQSTSITDTSTVGWLIIRPG